MAEDAQAVDVADRYTITLGPDASAQDIEDANARANQRDPRPVGTNDVIDAPEDTAPPQDEVESVDESFDEEPEDREDASRRQRRRRPNVEQRIQRLTRDREDARAAAQAEREQRIRLEARLEALEQQRAQPQDPEPPPAKPEWEDFDSQEDYLDAMLTWQRDQLMQEMAQRQAEHEQQRDVAQQQRAVEDAQLAILDQAAHRHGTSTEQFIQTLQDSQRPSEAVATLLDSLFQPDDRADVMYYLATHQDELQQLSIIQDQREVADNLLALYGNLRPVAPVDSEPPPPPAPSRSPRSGLEPLGGSVEPGAGEYDPYRDGIRDHEEWMKWRMKQSGIGRYG